MIKWVGGPSSLITRSSVCDLLTISFSQRSVALYGLASKSSHVTVGRNKGN
uniref:Uncharacterized protein n=1 Tax=Utricularia reniformis TaxID=192314 RepID=A0A1Y0B495_9LAMI|nr:hypothetical protein AEK19_MT2050 [Utricularia reniformis]ART32207.1 hypothetical protein AEK19_MT2050 [Utricularia reniformis]